MLLRVIILVTSLVLAAASASPAGASASPAPPGPGEGFFDVQLPAAVRGDLLVRSDGGLALALGDGSPFILRLTGDAVVVERTALERVVVENPASGAGVGQPVLYGGSVNDPESTTTEFGASTVTLKRAGDKATVFIFPGEPAAHSVEMPLDAGTLVVGAVESREYRTEAPDVEQTNEDDPIFFDLRYKHDAAHFLTSADDASLRATGNFSLFFWDVDFAVSDGASRDETFRTGHSADGGAGPVRTSEAANAVVRVTNGALSIQGAATGVLGGPRLAAAVDGNVSLPGAVGGFSANGVRYEANGSDALLDGDVLLSLSLVQNDIGRALVSVSGTVTGISLAPMKALDRATFLGTPTGQATAATGGLVVLAGSTLLLVRNRDRLASRVAPRFRGRGNAREAAVLALEGGDDATAAALFERALKATPDDVVMLVDYGCVLERLGRINDARDAYERAVRVDPTRAECHYYYSRVLLALGLTASALPHLQRALLLDPRLREMAREDRGFRAFSDHPGFIGLVA